MKNCRINLILWNYNRNAQTTNMPLTKTQCLNFLNNKKKETARGSIKYYTVGGLRLLVSKDILSVADIVSEFPELDTP